MNKAEFLTEFLARDITDGMETNCLQLMADFRVYSGVLDSIVNVPSGFIFQESIPQAVQGIAPLFGASKRAACLHDFAYQHRGFYDANGKFHPVTRAQADDVYREICEAKGMPKRTAYFRWLILRLVGWKAWNDDSRLISKPQPQPQPQPPTVKL